MYYTLILPEKKTITKKSRLNLGKTIVYHDMLLKIGKTHGKENPVQGIKRQ